MNKYANSIKNIGPKNSLSGIQSVQLYLNYCKKSNVNLNSTIFKGTLYELSTKAFLEDWLHCKELIKIGGSYDYGIDIRGKWDLNHYWINASQKYLTDSKNLGQLVKSSQEYTETKNTTLSNKLSLKNDVNILVQCKNFDQKVKASVIRELIGTYHFHIKKKKEFLQNYIFLISSHNLTKQAQIELDKVSIPVVHCKLKPLYFRDGDIYDVNNWSSSVLESVYLNKLSRKFLDGLNLELQLRLVMSDKYTD